jgi:hypothetical protein
MNAKIPLENWMIRSFHFYSSCEMEGCLTAMLLNGDMEEGLGISEEDARVISRNFVNSVGYSGTEVFKIEEAYRSKVLIAFNLILRRWLVFYLVIHSELTQFFSIHFVAKSISSC